MYLSNLKIRNFRRLNNLDLEFQDGINIILGPNNVGKTAVVDALRTLLGGIDEPYSRFTTDDIHRPNGKPYNGDIEFEFKFSGLELDDEADLLSAIQPNPDGSLSAVIGIRYGNADPSGRLRAKRWCGKHEDVPLSADMLENIRAVYLKPLRDASQGLRPSKNSQLSRLLNLLSDDDGKEEVNKILSQLDTDIKKQEPIKNTQSAIVNRHKKMLGEQLSQSLEVGLSATDFTKLAARLSLQVDEFDIEQNGLGYNSLIYMAVVLSELAKNQDAAFRGLIVEEPEAHLHPQLQTILLKHLSDFETGKNEKSVQVFVTSHSPNFASNAKLESIICLLNSENGVQSFCPRNIEFKKGKKEKLERYLDVTKAELFFARRIIFVEGAAELLLIKALAEKSGNDLRQQGVSLISVEGLNFDSFLPLFGENGIRIPVSVITDADPKKIKVDGEMVDHYPNTGDKITISDNTKLMKDFEDDYIKVFHGIKTFEYDLGRVDKLDSQSLANMIQDSFCGGYNGTFVNGRERMAVL